MVQVLLEGAESLDEEISALQQALRETLAHAVAIERALAKLTQQRLTQAALEAAQQGE